MNMNKYALGPELAVVGDIVECVVCSPVEEISLGEMFKVDAIVTLDAMVSGHPTKLDVLKLARHEDLFSKREVSGLYSPYRFKLIRREDHGCTS